MGFHVGSVFQLDADVVQSSGLVWARLGGSSSSQILREAVFVLQALQFYLQRKPQTWSVACQAIPGRGDPEKCGKSHPPGEVPWELGNPGVDCKKRSRLQACADMFWAQDVRAYIDTDPVNQPQPLNHNIPQYVCAVRDGPAQQHYQEDGVRAVREDQPELVYAIAEKEESRR